MVLHDPFLWLSAWLASLIAIKDCEGIPCKSSGSCRSSPTSPSARTAKCAIALFLGQMLSPAQWPICPQAWHFVFFLSSSNFFRLSSKDNSPGLDLNPFFPGSLPFGFSESFSFVALAFSLR